MFRLMLEVKRTHVRNLSTIIVHQTEDISHLVTMAAGVGLTDVDSRALLQVLQKSTSELRIERDRYEEEMQRTLTEIAELLKENK